MREHARVVVIGGGVVGVSTLYHLAKKGWTDCVLVERTELTAGSTWHAAGLLPLFNMSYSVGQLHQYSVELYKNLEEETGQNVSFHVNGNLRLAATRDRMDEYRNYACTADTIGVHYEFLTPSEVKSLWPLAYTDDLEGAIFHPTDGHIAPADLTMALARGARTRGAEIYQHTPVTGISQKPNGEWVVHTAKGDITCEHIVQATGNYARETAAMVGLDIPSIPVEHQYIVTDTVPELKEYREAGNKELPVLRDSDTSYYLREERMGWLLGPYEKGAPARFADGVPESFEKDLFPGDLDRLMPHIEACIHRVPSFESAGIKDIVNGPIAYTPDGSPMVGPAFSLRNYWLSEGHSFGITAAGGAGWQLAEWIVEGEPSVDMNGVDPRRFGAYANKNYAIRKNEEAYEHVFVIHYPTEERPAARPQKRSPIWPHLDKANAVWGQRHGWERANFFAPSVEARKDHWSFRRADWFAQVGEEVRAMRERVGIMDLSPFSKYEVEGPGAQDFLDGLIANVLPKKVGRINLTHALMPSGSVNCEFTITRLAEDRFWVIAPQAADRHHYDFLLKNLPDDRSVSLTHLTGRYGCLMLAGPHARKVLEKLADGDVSKENFKWLSMKEMAIGLASDVRAMRVNFVGSLGWELHVPMEYMATLYEQLWDAGKEFDIANVGMRAMDSMRLEKSYRMWATDLNQENTILEASMDRFVRLNKGNFVGRDALVRQQQEGVPNRFVTLEIDAEDADAFGNEPVMIDGEVVGRATAGGFGHYVQKSLMMGYVRTDVANEGQEVKVRLLDQERPARIIPESPYDPENEALRA
ncbi:GcvT family protein [Ferruginivarius sediminum]|uniref:FAD-dependent oxidoreductase n=1 Tax=Ferruginivarius sediminum TaxID=2661937 RepID=A0A369T6C0_9PROT|nr:FAD-dependent oxidoreductase [Ferruginivarius sediminum]RDD60818.1 FAD-dependent oxidoreductase [Ferruginivarius sediminum]